MTERMERRIGAALAWLLFIPMLIGALFVLGRAIDAQDNRSIERHRCLKQATNGLEIEACKR